MWGRQRLRGGGGRGLLSRRGRGRGRLRGRGVLGEAHGLVGLAGGPLVPQESSGADDVCTTQRQRGAGQSDRQISGTGC